MASKQQKKTGFSPMLGLFAVGVVGLAALAAYVKFGGASKIPEPLQKVPSIQQTGSQQHASTVTLVTPTRDGNDLKLGHHESDVPAGEEPMLFAVNHFLTSSKIVPADAKAVGVQVKDGVAMIDVSPSFNQSYGSFDEEALLKGICDTLAQFPSVQKVQFYQEGKVIESLGNVDLSEGISVRPKSGSSEN